MRFWKIICISMCLLCNSVRATELVDINTYTKLNDDNIQEVLLEFDIAKDWHIFAPYEQEFGEPLKVEWLNINNENVLEESYSKTKPINYQITAKDIQQVGEDIATDPTKAMTNLMVSAKINDEFMPVEVMSDVSDSQDLPDVTLQPLEQERSDMTTRSSGLLPIRSVRSINKEPEKKPEKRLGVKAYRLNPDNFK